MMNDLNKATLIGRIGKEPIVRSMKNGNKLCSLALATKEEWTDKKTKKKQTKTEWHKVTIFSEKLVELASKHLKIGASVYVEGIIKTTKWTDKSKIDRWQTCIVLNKNEHVLTLLEGATEDMEGLPTPKKPKAKQSKHKTTEPKTTKPRLGEIPNDDGNTEPPF